MSSFIKIQNCLPFWCWLVQVVMEVAAAAAAAAAAAVLAFA